MDDLNYTTMPSPLGEVLIAADARGLRRIVFQEGTRRVEPPAHWRRSDDDEVLKRAVRQLREYFDGKRRSFELPLAPEGTPFQQEVWRALCEVPWGETRSYGDLAMAIGRPTATRAVGAANGRNPLPIVIPCHRVIGASGRLTGYAGGIHLKEGLLQLEGVEGEAPAGAPRFL